MTRHYLDVLKALMKTQGVTQRHLADRLDVTEARVAHIFNAKSNPTVRTLARVSAALGYRIRFRFVNKTFHEQVAVWSLAA